jgi:predicted amino acid-binding ACT domain protein
MVFLYFAVSWFVRYMAEKRSEATPYTKIDSLMMQLQMTTAALGSFRLPKVEAIDKSLSNAKNLFEPISQSLDPDINRNASMQAVMYLSDIQKSFQELREDLEKKAPDFEQNIGKTVQNMEQIRRTLSSTKTVIGWDREYLGFRFPFLFAVMLVGISGYQTWKDVSPSLDWMGNCVVAGDWGCISRQRGVVAFERLDTVPPELVSTRQ